MGLPTVMPSIRYPEILGSLQKIEFAPGLADEVAARARDLDGTGVVFVMSEALPDGVAFRCTYGIPSDTKVRSYKRDWSPL